MLVSFGNKVCSIGLVSLCSLSVVVEAIGTGSCFRFPDSVAWVGQLTVCYLANEMLVYHVSSAASVSGLRQPERTANCRQNRPFLQIRWRSYSSDGIVNHSIQTRDKVYKPTGNFQKAFKRLPDTTRWRLTRREATS